MLRVKLPYDIAVELFGRWPVVTGDYIKDLPAGIWDLNLDSPGQKIIYGVLKNGVTISDLHRAAFHYFGKNPHDLELLAIYTDGFESRMQKCLNVSRNGQRNMLVSKPIPIFIEGLDPDPDFAEKVRIPSFREMDPEPDPVLYAAKDLLSLDVDGSNAEFIHPYRRNYGKDAWLDLSVRRDEIFASMDVITLEEFDEDDPIPYAGIFELILPEGSPETYVYSKALDDEMPLEIFKALKSRIQKNPDLRVFAIPMPELECEGPVDGYVFHFKQTQRALYRRKAGGEYVSVPIGSWMYLMDPFTLKEIRPTDVKALMDPDPFHVTFIGPDYE